MNTTLRPGDSVTTADQFNALPMGTVLTDDDGWIHTKVADYVDDSGSHTTEYVGSDGGVGTFVHCWLWGAAITSFPEVAIDDEDDSDAVLTRPLVHFDDEKAGRDRSKAREAARLAISTANKNPSTNVLLAQAADGRSVDAYALNAAVLDAMRSATTRHGQSMGRRNMAKQFAHLGHIVQAVLENHADNLPAYGEGERSRVVHEAKIELAKARVEIDNVVEALRIQREENTTLKQAASDERRRICGDLDDAKTALGFADQRISDLIREKTAIEIEFEELQAAYNYAFSRLSDADQNRVAGFRDGYQDRANHDA